MTDIQAQYNAVRHGIGLMDRSDAGKIAIYGEDRFTWLQGMVSNDVKVIARKGFYGFFQACVLDATGHILTDLSLVRVDGKKGQELAEALGLPVSEFVLADLPRENIPKIMALWERLIIMEDVELKDVSEKVGCLCAQGRYAEDLWEGIAGAPEDYFRDIWKQVYVMPAGYTGEPGFNAYFPMERKSVISANIKGDPVHVGAEAQDILRVEAGIPKYGADMDETTLAPEAGLMATHISLIKGCYVGQEIVARIDSRGHTNRALTGLVFDEDAPACGDRIVAAENGQTRETGRITSVIAASPALNGQPIALGYVRHEHRAPGNVLEVAGTGKTRRARVVELPFYRRDKTT